MTPEQIGIVGCVALVVLLCSSMPVAFAMAVVGFVGFAVVVSPHAAVSVVTFDLYKTFASYSLTVIPLFVLMGQVAFHGGISRRLFDAAGTILITMLKRQLPLGLLVQSLKETLRTSCMVMIIVGGAVAFGHFLAVTRIPFAAATWLGGLPLPAWVVMGLIVVFYLIAGCFVDALALVLLTIPIFYPVVTNLGYDPIWFGVMIVAAVLLIMFPDIALLLPRWIHP